ncbi:hypothetical protein PG984_007860 [Apiospora sp. TS-2023a]
MRADLDSPLDCKQVIEDSEPSVFLNGDSRSGDGGLIPLINPTANHSRPCERHYNDEAKSFTNTDQQNVRNLKDCTLASMAGVEEKRLQPESSQAAIRLYERMHCGSDSMIERFKHEIQHRSEQLFLWTISNLARLSLSDEAQKNTDQQHCGTETEADVYMMDVDQGSLPNPVLPKGSDHKPMSFQTNRQGLNETESGCIRTQGFHLVAKDTRDQNGIETLSEAYLSPSESLICESEDSSSKSDGSGEIHSGSACGNSEAASSSTGLNTLNATQRRKRSLGSEADEDNDEDGTQKRRRHKGKCPDTSGVGSRLACPYQAYDKSQVCLGPSAQNPSGGCAGIGRLRSFDKMQEKADHEAMEPVCEHRESPPIETMMNESQEGEFERLRLSGPAESSWWRIFQLLIPGMSERDITSLKLEYWPYYVRSDSFMIPAITFSNSVFQPSRTPESSGSLNPTNESHSNPPLPIELDWSLFDYRAPDAASNSAPTFEGPLFEAPDAVFPDLVASPRATLSSVVPSLSVGTLWERDDWTSSSASSLPPIPNAPSIDTSRPSETVLRRNHDRLRNRLTTTERENAELRETAQRAWSSLSQIDAALEDVLNEEELPVQFYDKLSDISKMIASLKERS